MHNVSIAGTGAEAEGTLLFPVALRRLDASDRGGETVRASWVWFQDRWQRYPDGREMYVAYYDRDHPDSWAYVLFFAGGARGLCQVRDINEALAALNCEIDRRGDAAD